MLYYLFTSPDDEYESELAMLLLLLLLVLVLTLKLALRFLIGCEIVKLINNALICILIAFLWNLTLKSRVNITIDN